MPATEQTWWDMKVLHISFCVVAVVLLIATVVMLSVDHNRPWKKYQRTFRALETWSASANVSAENSRAFAAQTGELEASLAEDFFDVGVVAAGAEATGAPMGAGRWIRENREALGRTIAARRLGDRGTTRARAAREPRGHLSLGAPVREGVAHVH